MTNMNDELLYHNISWKVKEEVLGLRGPMATRGFLHFVCRLDETPAEATLTVHFIKLKIFFV